MKQGGRPRGSYKADPLKMIELRRQGFNHLEIAKRLGVSTKTVQRTLNRAKSLPPSDIDCEKLVRMVRLAGLEPGVYQIVGAEHFIGEESWRRIDFYEVFPGRLDPRKLAAAIKSCSESEHE